MPRARNAIASTATRTPRIVTTRTSLCMRRDDIREDMVRRERKAEYFLLKIWTGEISLNPLDKLAVWRTRFRACFEASGETICKKSN